MFTMEKADNLIEHLEKCMTRPGIAKGELYAGIDLGTAYMVLTVIDSLGNPVAGTYRFAQVVRDGVVVDFTGASRMLRELKSELEQKLGTQLVKAAGAFPPDTGKSTVKSHFYVCEGAGFEVINMVDEPTAANNVLCIENGAVVDIGGGTTGIAIIQDGEVVYTTDEPTGGTHFSLVIAGAKKISFEEAEDFKKQADNQQEVMFMVKPVVQKVASIIKNKIRGFNISSVYLVGGTCCLEGIEKVIESELNIPTFKPRDPLLVTPLGIALSCLGVSSVESRNVEAYY
ncbi:MAG: ethanolamine utilization protein EutJ [Tepidanaerobacter acetatoxydans]|uniref:ethanolamine utilization protein EutJ n=1 Tax=Tepidanaerobacter acetatoxydans TaxID=499229 RepID=UPI0026ECD682|nr:ethanolamine utilization protein EutJ [Tepidanaerobacter acetatoxydans]NLU09924.1 ethanolamine utilization protein EutJ [Tepidanaerobacter acetatoxydans]